MFVAADYLPQICFANALSRHHSDRAINLETPSEFDLTSRIQAQVAMVIRAFKLSLKRAVAQLKRILEHHQIAFRSKWMAFSGARTQEEGLAVL